MYVCMYVIMYVCMYVRMYVCMYVCVYVCMYVCTYLFIVYIMILLFLSNYFVRLFYLNDNTIDGFNLTNTTSLLTPLQIPDCDQLCPLDKFIA